MLKTPKRGLVGGVLFMCFRTPSGALARPVQSGRFTGPWFRPRQQVGDPATLGGQVGVRTIET